jgi:hypothetical protein
MPWLQSGRQAGIEVHGTARGAELWALPFAPVPLPVGKEVKIVWRMTQSRDGRCGPPHLRSIPRVSVLVSSFEDLVAEPGLCGPTSGGATDQDSCRSDPVRSRIRQSIWWRRSTGLL